MILNGSRIGMNGRARDVRRTLSSQPSNDHPAMLCKDDKLGEVLKGALGEMQAAGKLASERVLTSAQGPWISIASTDKKVLNFCSNNYLGLGTHPAVIAAAKQALDSHGFGLASTRFICGTQDLHKALEAAIAKFHCCEDAILYGSCFDANSGLFEGLLGEEDVVVYDERNHASSINGIRLCKARSCSYRHLDMGDLDAQLSSPEVQAARVKLVFTDGVFPLEGDVIPLKELLGVARKHGAVVAIDESHATGILGATGKGTEERDEVIGQVDIINSTLGKAMGGAVGGYTTGRADVIALLRRKSRPYTFSNTLPPALVGASLEVYRMLEGGSELLDTLRVNTGLFRTKMAEAGFTIRGVDHPIVPVMLGDDRIATEMANQLLEEGVYVIGFGYPVVPKGEARIRVQMTAVHTADDIEHAVRSFVKVGRKLGVLKETQRQSSEP